MRETPLGFAIADGAGDSLRLFSGFQYYGVGRVTPRWSIPGVSEYGAALYPTRPEAQATHDDLRDLARAAREVETNASFTARVVRVIAQEEEGK